MSVQRAEAPEADESQWGERAIHPILPFALSSEITLYIPNRSWCDWCGEPYAPVRGNQHYCSRRHSQVACERRKEAAIDALSAFVAPYGMDRKTVEFCAEMWWARTRSVLEKLGYHYSETLRLWAKETPVLIDIKNDLKLTVGYFSGKNIACLGIPGTGKTNTARVLLEELIPYVNGGTIIDIDGDHVGLKERLSNVRVIGGDSGDEPMVNGQLVAHRGFVTNQLTILDFSGKRSGEMFEFLDDYMNELWDLISPESARKPYLLLIEEAHKFAPETRTTAIKDLLIDFASRGRKRGFVTIYTTQFPQLISKKLLQTCQIYFFHRVDHPLDKRVIATYVPRDKERVFELIDMLTEPGDVLFRDGSRVQVVTVRKSAVRHTGTTPQIVGPVDEPRAAYIPLTDESNAELDVMETPGEPAVYEPVAPVATPITLYLNESEKPDQLPWHTGLEVANIFYALFDDLCDRISVGGSLRRSRTTIGDVEMILQPNPNQIEQFARRCELLLLNDTINLRLNKVGNRIAWSARERCFWYKQIPVDFFIVQPDRQWGPTAILRTGSNAANQALVTPLGRKTTLGDPGVMPTDLLWREGGLTRNGLPLNTPEEADVFSALKLPFVPPYLRTPGRYLTHLRSPDHPSLQLPERARPADWGYAREPEGKWRKFVPSDLFKRNRALQELHEQLIAEGEIVKQESLL